MLSEIYRLDLFGKFHYFERLLFFHRFPCYRWLDRDEEDGEIERQITLSGVTGTPIERK